MKAAPAFGYHIANFTGAQVTHPCQAEMTTRQQMNPDWQFRREDGALHSNDKDLPALGSIPGAHPDPSWWNTLQENCSLVWIGTGAYDFNLLNDPKLGTK